MGCDTCVWGAGDARGRRLGRGHSTDFPSLERWEAVASGQLVSLLGTQDAEATGVCDGRSAGVLGGWVDGGSSSLEPARALFTVVGHAV